jgi:hypothetical protein
MEVYIDNRCKIVNVYQVLYKKGASLAHQEKKKQKLSIRSQGPVL